MGLHRETWEGQRVGEEDRKPRYSVDMAPGTIWGMIEDVIGDEWTGWVGSRECSCYLLLYQNSVRIL